MCPEIAADLHLHTTASDGRLTVERLPAAAKRAGVDWIAVTDHDCIHPELTEPVSVHDEITIIRGIELRVATDAQRVDLLGYGVEPTAELTAELDRLQTNRRSRAQRIIDRVESYTGVDLHLEPHAGIGRPHIARAIADSEAPYSYSQAFEVLIGDDGPCFVPREITPAATGIELLSEACRLVGLAHPLRYDNPAEALELTAELDAVERYYPYSREIDTTLVDRTIDRYGLLATGGSDAHTDQLGTAGVPHSQFDAFRAQFEA